MKKEWVDRRNIRSCIDGAGTRIIYIQGQSGWGKTIAVRQWYETVLKYKIWIQLTKEDDQPVQILRHLDDEMSTIPAGVSAWIVLDDYYHLVSQEAQRAVAKRICQSDETIHWVIISRKRLSKVFIPLTVKGELHHMKPSNLAYSNPEIREAMERWDVSCNWEDVAAIRRMTQGWPLAVEIMAQEAHPMPVPLDWSAIYARSVCKCNEYIAETILKPMEPELYRLMATVSLLPYFTRELAVAITGASKPDIDNQVYQLLEIGSFVNESPNGILTIMPRMMEIFDVYRNDVLTEEQCRNALQYAGDWCYANGDNEGALYAYFKGGASERGIAVLKEVLGNHPGIESFYNLEPYMRQIPTEVIQHSPILCYGAVMIHSINYRLKQGRYWADVLAHMDEVLNSEECEQERLRYYQICCSIAIPYVKNDREMLKSLWKASQMSFVKEIQTQSFTMTGNQPRLMAGSKDFCAWSQHVPMIRKALSGPLKKLFGKSAIGIPETGTAEVFYQRNELARCASEAARGIARCRAEGIDEIRFVGEAMIIQVLWANGEMAQARRLEDSLLKSLMHTHLAKGAKTFWILGCLVRGEEKPVRLWLETEAPDENAGGFRVFDRYAYLVKIRAYLSLDMAAQAIKLTELIHQYAEDYGRTYNYIETIILRAICLERLGESDQAEVEMTEALARCAKYGFIRIIADEGNGCLAILERLAAKQAVANPTFLNKVIGATRDYADFHPKHYHCPKTTDTFGLTPTEMMVLKRMDAGLRNKEIANDLAVSLATIKTHINRIYRKLEVTNRVKALQVAKQHRLL